MNLLKINLFWNKWLIFQFNLQTCRSSHQRHSVRKGVLRNFAKFTGKHLCQSESTRAEACNFIKKEALAQVFSYEFCEISQNTFLTEHLLTTASWRETATLPIPFYNEFFPSSVPKFWDKYYLKSRLPLKLRDALKRFNGMQ